MVPNKPDDERKLPAVRADEANSRSPSSARTYSRRELGLILQRASEQQASADAQTDSGFSIADIRQIAGEVGIEPRHVESAALALSMQRPQGHTLLGAPWRFRFEETVDGEISDDAVAELIELARRETSMQGEVRQALNSIEWTARDSMGATVVQVTRRGGKTTIAVLSARTDAAAIVGIFGGLAAFFGSIGVSVALAATAAVALAASATVAVPAAIAAGVVTAGGGSWFVTRAVWRRIAARYAERAKLLARVLTNTIE